jgi:hypothetical protein
MITVNNYFTEINSVGIDNLPDTLRKSHEFVVKSTGNGSSWEVYNTNATIRKVIDLYLAKLNEYVDSKQNQVQTDQNESPEPKKQIVKQTPAKKARPKSVKEEPKASVKPGKLVEHIREEVKFIKRYVGLHNKVKSPGAILNMVKALQRSIVQKLIKKESPLAKEIQSIQDKLVSLYNSMKSEKLIEINAKDLVRLVSIAGGEAVYPSINVIRRFVGMQGKELEDKKVDAFIRQIENSVKNKKILKDDPYADKVNRIYKLLKQRTSRTIALSKAELNGLEGILEGCNCKNDLGKIYHTQGRSLRQCKKRTYSDAKKGACSHNKGLSGILTAEEIANREIDSLSFNYRWSSLLGKPARNFTMMIHGEPGGGKTTFLLKFAQYLAENFGKVIFISSEEFAATTLTTKVKELFHEFPPNLHFTEKVNQYDLSGYDFIVLDSVNDLGLTIADFKQLRQDYPNAAFILLLQHTKSGQFKGGKEWEHETEIAGEIINGVVTIYKNRYGVKGSFDFFNN